MITKTTPVILHAVYAYLATAVVAIISAPLFGKFYLAIFNPSNSGGLSGYASDERIFLIQSIIFAIPFFLPLFIAIFVERKSWLIWLIGAIIPFLMFLVGGQKHLWVFIMLTAAGALLGWLIKMTISKFTFLKQK